MAHEMAAGTLLGNGRPNADLVAWRDLITDIDPPLPETEAVVIVLGQEIVDDAPAQADVGALKQTDRREALRAARRSLDALHHAHGVARRIDGRADLCANAERLDERHSPIHRSASAELSVDAKILRLLRAVEPDKDRCRVERPSTIRQAVIVHVTIQRNDDGRFRLVRRRVNDRRPGNRRRLSDWRRLALRQAWPRASA